VNFVDLLVEACRQGCEDIVLLGLGQPSGRHRGVEILLRRSGERRLEAFARLAVGDGDGRQRLAGGELRPQVARRDAEVGRGRVERDRPAALATVMARPARVAPEREERRVGLGEARLDRRGLRLRERARRDLASIWSTIAFLMAAVRSVALHRADRRRLPRSPGSAPRATHPSGPPRLRHHRRPLPRARRRRSPRAVAAFLQES
jgi:hypothetical protein